MTPQLPKQTIERIEREADAAFPSGDRRQHREVYRIATTREALLVLPVLEAAKEYLETTAMIVRQHSGMTEDLYNDLQKALAKYEALNKENYK